MLSRTEEHLAATIEQQAKRISELNEQTMVLTAMMDRFYLGVMQHLPEVPEELANSAVAGATRRHRKWLGAVEKLLAEDVADEEVVDY